MQTALIVLSAALTTAVPASAPARSGWTLPRARSVLAARDFAVTDTTQPDQPQYDLVFTRRQARSLHREGRRLVFAGRAHDLFTDSDVDVRFAFGRPGRIAAVCTRTTAAASAV